MNSALIFVCGIVYEYLELFGDNAELRFLQCAASRRTFFCFNLISGRKNK